MFTPQVGQSLHFFAKGSGPFAATVAAVNEDGTVNISRLDAQGDVFPQTEVLVYDHEGDVPEMYVAIPVVELEARGEPADPA